MSRRMRPTWSWLWVAMVFMLETLHRFMDSKKPIFGMNRGSVGFLMNDYKENDLHNRITKANPIELHSAAHDGNGYIGKRTHRVGGE